MSDEEQAVKCPAGIPAWVMTFADLMSLLMCFFVLLLSFSEMDALKYKQIAGSLKFAFGVQREVEVEDIPKGINIVAKEFSPAPPQETVLNEVKQSTTETLTEIKLIKKISELQEQQEIVRDVMDKAESEKEKKELEEKLEAMQQQEEKLQEQLEVVQKQIQQMFQSEIDKTTESLKEALEQEIEEEMIDVESNAMSVVIRIREKGSFGSGRANIQPAFRKVLARIRDELAKTDGTIVVAGHTDNLPIATARFRSNWELSSARAVSVVHELLKGNKIDKKRFAIEGFADAKPLDSNKTAAGRAKNRRVEIIITKGKKFTEDKKANKDTVKEKEKNTPPLSEDDIIEIDPTLPDKVTIPDDSEQDLPGFIKF